MKLFQLWMLGLCLFLCLCVSGGEARRLQQRRNANTDTDPAPVIEDDGVDESDEKEKFVSDATTTEKPKGIASVKSRAIAMDRGLCQEQSRYHPHYPKCHQYCKRLEHWIGQCWRESCHCIS